MFVALNTFPQVAGWERAERAVDRAAELGVDAVIIADAGLMQYAAATHPQLRLHLSVQGSATNYEAINFYHRHFHIKRAVLPRVLSLAQVKQVIAGTPVEIEVFGFGSLCVMVEGRCALSSYATGESPNTVGVCSPAKAVRWQQTPAGLESRLNGILIDRYAADENAGVSDAVQGTLRGRRRDLLRDRGTGEPQHARADSASCSRPASPRSRSKAGSAARPMSRR